MNRYSRRLALLAALPLSSAFAQTNGDSFDVTVEPNESQSEVVTQGPASLDGASLSLNSLQQFTSFLRLGGARPGSSNEENRKKQKTALLASLGTITYAALADEGEEKNSLGVDFSRFGGFGDLTYGFGSHDTTPNTPAYDLGIFNLTAGVDYRFSPSLAFGGAFIYTRSQNDFDGGIGDLDVDGFGLAMLGNWYPTTAWYIDGIIRGAVNDYDTSRRDTAGGVARGASDGAEFSLSSGSGYEFNLRGWTAGPTVRVNYTNVSIDGYAESNSSQALEYDDQDIDSLTTNLGAQASRAFNTRFGVLLPQADLEWIHEFEDDGRRIIARPAAGGPAFAVPVDELDSNYFRGSIGATMLLAHGRMFFLRYEGEFGRADRSQNSISLGARLEF